jgi:hypothetical protein
MAATNQQPNNAYQYQLTTLNNVDCANIQLIPKSTGYAIQYTYPNQHVHCFKLLTPFANVHKISNDANKLFVAMHPTIQSILDKIFADVAKAHPDLSIDTIKSPISKSGHFIIHISKIATINIHRNKNAGPKVLTVNCPHFVNQFKMTAPILFFRSYPERLDPKVQNDMALPIEKRLYYKSKFVLRFDVTINAGSAYINAYADEIEMKYNVTGGGNLIIKSIEKIVTPIELATSISI